MLIILQLFIIIYQFRNVLKILLALDECLEKACDLTPLVNYNHKQQLCELRFCLDPDVIELMDNVTDWIALRRRNNSGIVFI